MAWNPVRGGRARRPHEHVYGAVTGEVSPQPALSTAGPPAPRGAAGKGPGREDRNRRRTDGQGGEGPDGKGGRAAGLSPRAARTPSLKQLCGDVRPPLRAPLPGLAALISLQTL